MGRKNKRIHPGKGISCRATPAELIRFLNRLKVVNGVFAEVLGPCWEWQGHCDEHGYGQFWFRGKAVWSHRFARAQFGPWPMPDGLEVNHKCHNHSCCNPAHLHDLTVSENRADTYRPAAATAPARDDNEPW